MDNDILLSVFVAVEGAHAFSAFMPSVFTIRKFTEADDLSRLRSGYIPATFFNLVLGGAVSALTKKRAPLVISAVMVVFMILMYEYAIRQEVK